MPIDTDSANLFFQLIARWHERNSTIITTNTPFSKWSEIFGSTTLANAVLDRLLHHSQIVSIKGPSYRLKEKRAFLETQADGKCTFLFSVFYTNFYCFYHMWYNINEIIILYDGL